MVQATLNKWNERVETDLVASLQVGTERGDIEFNVFTSDLVSPTAAALSFLSANALPTTNDNVKMLLDGLERSVLKPQPSPLASVEWMENSETTESTASFASNATTDMEELCPVPPQGEFVTETNEVDVQEPAQPDVAAYCSKFFGTENVQDCVQELSDFGMQWWDNAQKETDIATVKEQYEPVTDSYTEESEAISEENEEYEEEQEETSSFSTYTLMSLFVIICFALSHKTGTTVSKEMPKVISALEEEVTTVHAVESQSENIQKPFKSSVGKKVPQRKRRVLGNITQNNTPIRQKNLSGKSRSPFVVFADKN
jgi:hypothetical protein